MISARVHLARSSSRVVGYSESERVQIASTRQSPNTYRQCAISELNQSQMDARAKTSLRDARLRGFVHAERRNSAGGFGSASVNDIVRLTCSIESHGVGIRVINLRPQQDPL